jgi:hypothetical protein
VNIKRLQEGLIHWFSLDPASLKSLRNIENICTNLFQQYFPLEKPERAKYKIFYPLIKYGIIEFYGNNSFALSPSCALHNNELVLFINVSTLDSIEKDSESYNTNYSSLKLYKNTEDKFSLLNRMTIPYNKFLLSKSLLIFPSIKSIINSWTDEVIHNSNDHYFLNANNKWVPCTYPLPIGVHRKSKEVYSQRILKLAGKWKCIPSRENNIDAFNYAVVWGQIQNGWDTGINYFPLNDTLVVHNTFFPIILERLLYINTLLESKPQIEMSNRQYFINQKDFKLLNALFENKINIR